MITFFVGSANPTKVNAAKLATAHQWPDAVVEGFDVESGVSHQPNSDAETRQGAEQRAQRALARGLKHREKKTTDQSETILGIGMEGGIFEKDGEMWSTVWVAVVDMEGKFWVANGARFKVPLLVAERIRQGEEMGHAVQHITKLDNIKQKHGMLGVITENFISRTEEYMGITKLAVGLWYGRNWQNHY
jgi:inosine/xanthosine triphosphatase